MSVQERAEHVREVSRRAVAPLGLEVPDVVVTPAGKRSVVRVLIELPLPQDDDGSTPVELVTLDQVAEATEAVSTAIDEDDPFGETPYTLEVSSPGVDRPLTSLEHFRRAVGRLVEFVPQGGEPFTARVVRVHQDTVHTDDGRALSLAEAGTGRVQVEFRR